MLFKEIMVALFTQSYRQRYEAVGDLGDWLEKMFCPELGFH